MLNLTLCYFSGTPVLFVTPWTVVKILYENTEWVFNPIRHNQYNKSTKMFSIAWLFNLPVFLRCWSIVNRWFWWIIRGPITLSVLVSDVSEPILESLSMSRYPSWRSHLVPDASGCFYEPCSSGASSQVNFMLRLILPVMWGHVILKLL